MKEIQFNFGYNQKDYMNSPEFNERLLGRIFIDKRLSLETKAVCAYMCTYPPVITKTFYTAKQLSEILYVSKEKIETCLKELEANNYLR
jgi:hypothetical protein